MIPETSRYSSMFSMTTVGINDCLANVLASSPSAPPATPPLSPWSCWRVEGLGDLIHTWSLTSVLELDRRVSVARIFDTVAGSSAD